MAACKESSYKWQNVILCLATGEVIKGIHIIRQFLTTFVTMFYIQHIYTYGFAEGTEK
jgi:hypothetical protein